MSALASIDHVSFSAQCGETKGLPFVLVPSTRVSDPISFDGNIILHEMV